MFVDELFLVVRGGVIASIDTGDLVLRSGVLQNLISGDQVWVPSGSLSLHRSSALNNGLRVLAGLGVISLSLSSGLHVTTVPGTHLESMARGENSTENHRELQSQNTYGI